MLDVVNSNMDQYIIVDNDRMHQIVPGSKLIRTSIAHVQTAVGYVEECITANR